VPTPTEKKPREPGFLRSKVWISDDFDATLPEEIQAAFEGRDPRKKR
jgi:hypothetical protein